MKEAIVSNIQNIDKISREIDECDVISFDIFDTVVLRPFFEPCDVLKYIEQKYNIENYFLNRTKAEKAAYSSINYPCEDTTFEKIYEKYSEITKLPENEVLAHKNIEIYEEINISIPNPVMKTIYEYAISRNKRVIFTSDMYLPKEVVEKILNKNGYNKYEKLYLSSVYSKLKKTGNLYKILIDELGVDSNKIFHIGDNVISDYKKAIENGIHSIRYEKYQDIANESIANIELSQKSLDISMATMLKALNSEKISHYSYWKKFGYDYAGPILFNYVKWINENAKKEKIDNLIFIARDGYLLEKILNKINPDIKTHYVYAPRSLNLAIQLNYDKSGEFTCEHVKTIIDYYDKRSEKINSIPDTLSVDEAVEIIENNMPLLKELAAIEFSNYKNYLIGKGISGENIMTVDSVSKFFSAQKLFEKILNKSISGLYYQIQRGANIEGENVKSYKQISVYSQDCLLVEFLMTSPEPPIDDVINSEVNYKTCSKSEYERIKVFKEVADGILEFVDDILKYNCSLDTYAPSNIITSYINNFIDAPTEIDKYMFKQVSFATDAKHQDYRPIFKNWYKKQKKLSVIVPVYNVGKFLPKTLYCLINQTYKNIEIICVNNGSTDNSLSIIKEYANKDSRIKIINENKVGLSEARNIGLRIATGDYVAFLDSDDWVNQDFYEKLIARLENDNSDIAIGQVYYHYSVDDIKKRDYVNKMNFEVKNSVVDSIEDKQYIIKACACWNKVYRKNLIKKNNLLFPKDLYIEDVLFTFETTVLAKRISMVKDAVMYYRQQPKSIMKKARTSKIPFDIFKIYDKCEQFLRIANVDKESKKKYKDILDDFEVANIFGWFLKTSDEHKPEFFKKMKKKFRKINLINNDFSDAKVFNMREATLKAKNSEEVLVLIKTPKLNLIEKLFSIKKQDTHKVVRFAGIKLKIKDKKYKTINRDKNKFIENIFSLKNSKDRRRKILTMLGIKIKFKRYIGG